jgi:two-component system, sensor histidine kinase LadS
MQISRLFAGLILGACICAVSAVASPAGNLPTIALADLLGVDAPPPPLSVRQRVSPGATVQQMATDPAAFEPFNPRITYPFEPESVMWLRLSVLADDKPLLAGWTLALPKPFVDRVEFHWQDPQGSWQVQAAGDRVAHSQWPVRSLTPQFVLPAMAPGVHTFYVRVQSSIGLHFSLQLRPTDQTRIDSQDLFFKVGLVLGLLVLMFVLCCALALAYRKAVYGWYALFVACNFFAVTGYLGFSSYAFWPQATWWPEYSVLVPVIAAAVAQLQFCRIMFLDDGDERWLRFVVWGIVGMCLLLIPVSLLTPDPMLRLLAYGLVLAACASAMLGLVLRALRQGSVLAGLWLLAYAPLLGTLGASVIDNFGLAAINGLSFNAPVYALLFEVPVLLVALHLHAKSQHGQSVHQTALASADHLKGCLPPERFAATAQGLWDDARRRKKDLGVAYVQAARDTDLAALVNTYDDQREQTQVIRVLRTVLREGDTLAQIQGDCFALFMPGQAVGEEFTSRLSRLVALGLMAEQDYAAAVPIRFRVVASSRASVAGNWSVLDEAMRAKLADSNGWNKRSIKFLAAKPVVAAFEPEDLSDFWAVAVQKSANQS